MTNRKLSDLHRILLGTNGIAIAFSGGVDSTFLAAVAAQVLGNKALAVTAMSPTYPQHEQKEACMLAKRIGIRHLLVDSNELEIPHFADNPPNRCYHCKSELFRILRETADRHGIKYIADGTNADDEGDYRPGRKAARELDVLSPLLKAGLGKREIRQLSRKMGLPTADKPAFACLASRFPYGSKITGEKLVAVDAVETGIRKMGFGQVRVRHHGDVARIEVEQRDIQRLASPTIRRKLIALARKAGFMYTSLDLEGYKTGSMNRSLALR